MKRPKVVRLKRVTRINPPIVIRSVRYAKDKAYRELKDRQFLAAQILFGQVSVQYK